MYLCFFHQLNFRIDPDSYPGVLGDFALQPSSEKNKAVIKTLREFDREAQSLYYINVVADDISPSDRMFQRDKASPNSGTCNT